MKLSVEGGGGKVIRIPSPSLIIKVFENFLKSAPEKANVIHGNAKRTRNLEGR